MNREPGTANPVGTRRSFVQFYAAPVLVMLLAYVLPMATGMAGVRAQNPQALQLREEVLRRVSGAAPIVTATAHIKAGRYVLAGLAVFLWNFLVGAVAMSTLVGVVFFAFPPLVAMSRGAMLGLLYDPSTFEGTHGLVAVITGLLELPTYMIAGALGIRCGLAWLLPPRRERMREAWEHAWFTIPAIAILLLLAAAWEVGGLALVGGLRP